MCRVVINVPTEWCNVTLAVTVQWADDGDVDMMTLDAADDPVGGRQTLRDSQCLAQEPPPGRSVHHKLYPFSVFA